VPILRAKIGMILASLGTVMGSNQRVLVRPAASTPGRSNGPFPPL
jgi:hypothetical protein